MFDTLMLSRIQFGANISFHILFPSITIALGWVLLFFKLRHVATGNPGWLEAYRFWVRVFALTFALGVVSGITMSFQFGTNWPGYMETVGNIAGPLLAYEILTAFFLEAVFLGIMLFGSSRVPPWLHTLATFLLLLVRRRALSGSSPSTPGCIHPQGSSSGMAWHTQPIGLTSFSIHLFRSA